MQGMATEKANHSLWDWLRSKLFGRKKQEGKPSDEAHAPTPPDVTMTPGQLVQRADWLNHRSLIGTDASEISWANRSLVFLQAIAPLVMSNAQGVDYSSLRKLIEYTQRSATESNSSQSTALESLSQYLSFYTSSAIDRSDETYYIPNETFFEKVVWNAGIAGAEGLEEMNQELCADPHYSLFETTEDVARKRLSSTDLLDQYVKDSSARYKRIHHENQPREPA
jgi:hypothetical protein